jgi:putative tryptophan/tyrosine transport system substrate-binding protein
MRRRDVLGIVGGAIAWPLAALAQQSVGVRRVGLLPTGYRQTDSEGQARVTAFVETLGQLGWRDGRNIHIEVRWPSNNIDEIRAEAIALAESKPDVFVVSSNAALTALKKLDNTIPTIFVQVSDPVGSGFVGSLAHPDGNITGFQNFEPEVASKWLQLLEEVAPALARAAVPVYADTAAHSQFLSSAQRVAPSLGLEVSVINVREGDDLERGIAEFAATPNGGLTFLPHPGSIDRRSALIELAARLRLPAIYPFRFFAANGGLMSYGFDQVEQWRGAAGYCDRILHGAAPGDLPVQAPTKYDLVINLKTAKALGLTISPSLLATAVDVIE